jgi:regulator of cell morphogenesis and NO signaling
MAGSTLVQPGTVDRRRADLAGCTIADAITARGKELSPGDTVATARRLFTSRGVQLLPVLDGTAFVGAIDRDSVASHVPADAAVDSLESVHVPTAIASTPAAEALARIDRTGAKRLVVLEPDGTTYVGLVCVRADRVRLCVDAASIHPPTLQAKGRLTMTAVEPEATVAALVLEQPGRARVFERFEIDYCCGGKVSLRAACAERGLDLDVVLGALREARAAGIEDADWTAASVGELCAHIVGHHHAYLRDELPRLRLLVEKVARAHGGNHPELADVEATFADVADELEAHMDREEQVLFPACVALESGEGNGFAFGSVGNPIRVMLDDHDEVAAGLGRLRRLTGDYEPPSDACNSYRAMLDRLHTLEVDLHRHVHEENNILFPRALELEAAA